LVPIAYEITIYTIILRSVKRNEMYLKLKNTYSAEAQNVLNILRKI
jgi:hypothetical protein